jgi:transcriptional regulator with XRE-family HTH domain
MKIEEAFGKVIKELRLEQDISQEKLAEKSELHLNSISLLERGINQPTISTIFAIAKAFGMKPEELVGKVSKEFAKLKK